MAGCALTQDFNLDCRDAQGGVKEFYIIELENVTTVTESSGIVTGITKATGKKFRKYSVVRETSNSDETIAGNEQNGSIFYNQAIQIILNKRQASVRNEILLLAKNHLIIVAVDNLGNGWLYGRVNGLMLNAGSANSGTAWADRNGYTLNFNGSETQLAPVLDAATLLTLQTAGA